MKTSAEPPAEQIIEPVPFKPASSRRPPGLLSRVRWLLIFLLAFIFLCIIYAVLFVFTARQVSIQITPDPDRISVKGALVSIHLGSNYLLRPGSYMVNAFKSGYQSLDLPLLVTGAKNQKLIAVMEKLPGRLTVSAHPEGKASEPIKGATVYVDGEKAGITPLIEIEVKPGLREVVIRADQYQDFKTSLEVEGMGTLQTINAALVSGWAGITVDSLPAGAEVALDGTARGETPLQLKLAAGTYGLEISAPHYKSWRSSLEVKEGQQQILDTVKLLPADGIIKLQTNPAGANVTIDKTFFGQTPVSIPLLPDTDHTLHISKAGHEKTEQRIRVASEEVREISLELKPITGTIHFSVTPENAELYLNDKPQGTIPRSLTLPSLPQKIKIVKEGYEPYLAEITPQPGFPQEISVTLLKKNAAPAAAGLAARIKAPDGYPLILVRPSSFTMGSSRQEQGRRSNETLREIIFNRPFYVGLKEVSNREFRAYLPGHDSGYVKDYSLNQDDLPVVNITWEQAAAYCNWLSEREKLPPVYRQQGGRLIAQTPLSTGYRLPTEAEWEYCARFTAKRADSLYPWGTTFPPPTRTVNIADLSARDLLPGYFDNYEDGYPASAPPATFAAGALGLYDLGGNVAEWCHDYYSIYPYTPGQRYQDPAGVQEGKHHLVRGSSFKHASISALRSAFRDYSSEKRPDVGFRICRYAD